MSKTLMEFQTEISINNHNHGWFEIERGLSDELMLIGSELFEAFDAYRDIGMTDRTRDPKPGEEFGKPDDFNSEIADVFIRLLDFVHRYHIDLEGEYERKMAYNRTRPYRHGGKRL